MTQWTDRPDYEPTNEVACRHADPALKQQMALASCSLCVSECKAYLEARYEIVSSGCWNWVLSLSPDGYAWGTCGKSRFMHRLAYQLYVGPIPAGLEIDHLCRNRQCVNPSHMEAVTHGMNMLRSSRARQTHCKSGHEFTEENTYFRLNGGRRCRTCARRWSAKYELHRRAAANGVVRQSL